MWERVSIHSFIHSFSTFVLTVMCHRLCLALRLHQ